jgi:hypothetical protein
VSSNLPELLVDQEKHQRDPYIRWLEGEISAENLDAIILARGEAAHMAVLTAPAPTHHVFDRF